MITLHSLRNGLRDSVIANMARQLMPGYIVIDDLIPYGEVVRSYRETGKILVWSGASDRAIFDRDTNWLFRAWHDWAHIRSQIDTTPDGEREVSRFQISEVQSTAFGVIIDIEVAQQASYFEKTGQFVADQIAFTIARLTQW